MRQIKSTVDLEAAIRSLIQYQWNDELHDFKVNFDEEAGTHVFRTLVSLDNFISGTNHTPESYIDRPAHEQNADGSMADQLKARFPWLGTADGDPTPYPSGADAIEALEQFYREL